MEAHTWQIQHLRGRVEANKKEKKKKAKPEDFGKGSFQLTTYLYKQHEKVGPPHNFF